MAGLIKRGKTWHLRMRVPRRYLAVAGRKEIHRSLETDSERRARELLPDVRAKLLAELDQMAVINARPDEANAYRAAQKIAQARGFAYRPLSDLLDAPIDEILERVEVATSDPATETAKVLLGAVEVPALRLSGLVDEVERIAAHDNRYKSENQMRLWRNPRKRAAANLQTALGGKDVLVSEIDHAAALKHKAWWQRKIAAENLSMESANKDFANMAGMLRRYYESIARPDPPEPYHRVSLKDRHKAESRKLEIPVDWIVEKWFAPGAFDGTNDEARDILLISIETGCRQSEIHDLPPGAFVLDQPYPHFEIKFEDGENRREIKNSASTRIVPLVGVALAAAKRHPDGFPRYRGKSTYSATMNKYMRSNGLLPSPNHTIGGVRHTWESRLLAETKRMDISGEMMGHSVKQIRRRAVYGDAMALPDRHALASRVMLHVPEHFQ
ncbi:DUF6538 domain-containing protein [Aquicoccus sp. G2-2]|uniref:DUF6538 domain-containing protein n=1 Tax=Aquicoccus sp. G2-2 TaxID=3092120 RepID=UPI002ADF2B0F|nr:DUF6538 domain-containing protein [Aquicoccus sp. G2-2]MEA1113207.1 DUF6538 domain-containing protein [Aquicoccus sp. G2-2]